MSGAFELKPGSWIHFVAIGGTGMGALASLLKRQGFQITGSDGPLYPPMSDFLDREGIARKEEYSAQALEGKTWGLKQEVPDVVVIGNAISRGHCEAEIAEQLAAEKKTTLFSFAQAMAHFAIQDSCSYVISGTHGKTTSTTMMAWALHTLGVDAGFFIGGIPGNFAQGSYVGKDPYFAIEGDEYDTAYWDKESKFLHYRPSWVMCTGIEFDHADIFENVEMIIASFQKLITKTKKGWLLVDSKTAPNADYLVALTDSLKDSGLKFYRYGFAEDSEVCIKSYSVEALPWKDSERGACFEISIKDAFTHKFHAPFVGKYNVVNFAGILAMLHYSGLLKDPQQISEKMSSYKGVARRQETKFESSEHVIIDDFAHHPTAIQATLTALKERFSDHYITVYFEPRSATSSRNIFFDDFVKSFEGAHSVFIRTVTKKNVPEEEKLHVKELVQELKKSKNFDFVETAEEAQRLYEYFEKADAQRDGKKAHLVILMSNGSFGGFKELLLERIKELK